MQLVVLIGGENGASFVNHHQCTREILSTLNWKPLYPQISSHVICFDHQLNSQEQMVSQSVRKSLHVILNLRSGNNSIFKYTTDFYGLYDLYCFSRNSVANGGQLCDARSCAALVRYTVPHEVLRVCRRISNKSPLSIFCHRKVGTNSLQANYRRPKSS